MSRRALDLRLGRDREGHAADPALGSLGVVLRGLSYVDRVADRAPANAGRRRHGGKCLVGAERRLDRGEDCEGVLSRGALRVRQAELIAARFATDVGRGGAVDRDAFVATRAAEVDELLLGLCRRVL